jgi:hypothetical protein
MAIAQPTAAHVPGEYPVQLEVTREREMNRLWGIPMVGFALRGFASIPHWVVLQVLNWAVVVWFFVGWIWILAFGRVPALAVKVIVEYLHRSSKVAGYMLLMPGGYPPLEPGLAGPTNLTVDLESLEINRWWGIPVFGFAIRLLIVMPQLIVLSLLAVAVVLTYLVLWIPILASGRYPDWAARFYGSVLQFGSQVGAYLMFLPVRYPPFWLN